MKTKATDIEGWMGAKGRRWLAKQARKHRAIIEVGAWKGRSTKVLASYTRGRVWAVDTWAGTPNDPEQHEKLYGEVEERGPNAILSDFMDNLRPEIDKGRVIPVQASSVMAATVLRRGFGRIFDFVFIDADHSYEGASGDIDAYLPLLVPGGLMSGHDYHWPGVERAVNERFTGVKLGPRSIWSIRV